LFLDEDNDVEYVELMSNVLCSPLYRARFVKDLEALYREYTSDGF
jgi:hypothetical protein